MRVLLHRKSDDKPYKVNMSGAICHAQSNGTLIITKDGQRIVVKETTSEIYNKI